MEISQCENRCKCLIFDSCKTYTMSLKKAGLIIFLILLVDQVLKIYIKTNFHLHESVKVNGWEWFQIYFVENQGAAWGVELPGE